MTTAPPDDVALLIRDLGMPEWRDATAGDLRLVAAAETAAAVARDTTLDAIQAVAEQIAERPTDQALLDAHRRFSATYDRHARRIRACRAYRAAALGDDPDQTETTR